MPRLVLATMNSPPSTITSEISLKFDGIASKSLICSKLCELPNLAFLVLINGLLKLDDGI